MSEATKKLASLAMKLHNAIGTMQKYAGVLEDQGKELTSDNLVVTDYSIQNVDAMELAQDGELTTTGDLVISEYSLRGLTYSIEDGVCVFLEEDVDEVVTALKKVSEAIEFSAKDLSNIHVPEDNNQEQFLVNPSKIPDGVTWPTGVYRLTQEEANMLAKMREETWVGGVTLIGKDMFEELVNYQTLVNQMRMVLTK